MVATDCYVPRGRPSGRRLWRSGRRPERTGGIASSVATSWVLSCVLAPVRTTPSGVPRASTTRWRFVPGLPRSVGFGPVAAPLFLPAGWRCRVPHGSSPVVRRRPAAPARRGAGWPTRPPSANHAAVASTTCPSRSPSPAAGTPTANWCAARTGCRSAPPGPGSAAARPLDAHAPVAAAARSPPRDRRERGTSPCSTNAPTAGFVRRSKADKTAGQLGIPLVAWVSFATLLAEEIWRKND